ncbi:MAG: hypothetical protein UV61_C0002G0211 [Candidatus Gottesmanbacteria bacterium GW2011_GWB1_43_11]|uniref:Integral membrane protein-like protein n=1 Tax=Candidatus Gottesmanbacteria bacterium GW2011_GWB1_43_11 TaxID=1618446 RepID=A0A0G1CP01_9BACT|nr:MAG: hypothetical protein UV04_C0001G0099 [Candidatus Gottesmanbacteria bacterium GW2011_GWA2_42_16]KKS56288.1 MAG: hypothetical protein UV17_C0001G0098 [Candidatus Gottesmanbacteria bacterium GW2011_GWA1_42_26]KKS82296.1 MAG: hypothetical protein UV55_C0003G0015 [Candidatus Gottesmanbacteria bacterium GW2011_GWC1_43_10]KKS87490.1 MAG: hypothetical protein UV61_C0002G0211 [Candidatus Gottesmanbacteria bacterium GW2011_GWB1_43_11]OGG10135.1 MAG: hypothetical protein A2699_01150 [Candidatus Go
MSEKLKIQMREWRSGLILIFVIGIIARLVLTNIVYSFDAASFVIWAKYLVNHRLADLFEFLPAGYTPYPPIYYYVLKVLGKTIEFFGWWKPDWLAYLLIKIPVFTADIIVASLVYHFTLKYLSKTDALWATGFYFLHPAIIYNTSVWGQIDSIIIAMGLVSIMLIFQKKIFPGLLFYLLDVLTKLQSLAMLPLILFLAVVETPFKKTLRLLPWIILIGILPFIPVVWVKGFKWTWDYFFTIPNWYAYTSVYTYNLWAPFGFIVTDNSKFLGLVQFKYLGIVLFWLAAVLILYPLRKKANRTPLMYMFAAFLLWYDFSYFATRIHSRYLIYSFGFFAPFFRRFPGIGILLSILMIADFLLPNKNPALVWLVDWLNQPITIVTFVIYAGGLFVLSYHAYQKLTKITHA